MKKILIIFFALFICIAHTNAQSWLWLEASTVNSANIGGSVATDKNGNAYSAGIFYQHIQFDSISLRANQWNTYFIKISPSGKVLWAEEPTQDDVTGYAEGKTVATDNFGNEYVTGNFEDTVSFGPYMLTDPVISDMFLVKYDSSGNALWARQSTNLHSYTLTGGSSVATDKSGNVYITGQFTDTIMIGLVTLITPTSHGNSGYGTFIAK